MLQLADYLALTVREAVGQWKSILMRSDVPPGGRQEDFTPVETLLCFGLGLVAPPSSTEFVNVRTSDPTVVRIAALVKRSPSSLAAKFSNLNGRRPNSAKYEQELWILLTSSDSSIFDDLYRKVMLAGRAVGLSENQLPDFLHTETEGLADFWDADIISTDELRESVETSLRSWVDKFPGGDALATEKALVGTARVGQKQFARQVLSNSGHACVFCGLSFSANGLPSARMLIASHIKPWRASSNSERRDANNGLAACPTHDAAFDSQLITVGLGMEIMLHPKLQRAVSGDPRVARNFGAEGMASSLLLPTATTRPDESYLSWHRNTYSLRAGDDQ